MTVENHTSNGPRVVADADDPFQTVGTDRLCAWATDETECRIQTNDPAIARRLARVPDIRLIGFSVTKKFLRLFQLPYTISYVSKNVVEKIGSLFPKKEEGSNSEIRPACGGTVLDDASYLTVAGGAPA